MKNARTPRRGLGTIAAIAAAALLTLPGAGTATAGIDSVERIVDGADNTIEAIQADTDIRFVAPLDGNPLSREWFQRGTAGFRVDGPGAKDFSGEIIVGYQVGYAASFNGKLKASYSTPSLGVELSSDPSITLGDLIPRAGIEIEVGFGPGIATVEAAKGSISGGEGSIRMTNFHGTLTGVVGPANIRPFVTVVSSKGDRVTTFGRTWSN